MCVWLTAAMAPAQEPMPTESGFSGYIEILGAYVSTNSQLSTSSGNKRTDSLDSAGDRSGKFRPFPLGLIRYTFAETRTKVLNFYKELPFNCYSNSIDIAAQLQKSNRVRVRFL